PPHHTPTPNSHPLSLHDALPISMPDETKPVTTHELLAMKERGERIVVLTCYDALFARLLDASGVDVLLVGDSVNQVLAGAETTLDRKSTRLNSSHQIISYAVFCL